MNSGMLFLTGDIHHRSLKNRHRETRVSETTVAKKYLSICLKYGINATLFVSGKTLEEEPDEIRELLKFQNLEIGGHTWNCFTPPLLHYAFKLLTGSFYGPAAYEHWDISKTIRIIEKLTGGKCVSWRGHQYLSDGSAYRILKEQGIRVVSDELGPDKRIRMMPEGLISLPINITPDHEYVYHGAITPATIARQLIDLEQENAILKYGPFHICKLGRLPSQKECTRALKECVKRIGLKRLLHVSSTVDRKPLRPFGPRIYHMNDWLRVIQREIDERIDLFGFATVLAHPACMEIYDGMEIFERLCRFIGKKKTTFFVRDLYYKDENKKFS